MDYSSMKAAELRDLAKERGVELPAGAKKAEIADLLARSDEPIDVPAVMVENEIAQAGAFEVDMTKVQGDIAELSEAIDFAMRVRSEVDASQDVIEQMNATDLAICENQLADAINAANEARLKLGRDYRKPLDAANARYKELMAPVEGLAEAYREQRESLRYMGLQRTYEDACAANGFETLPQLVTFDRLAKAHPRWMQRNANAAKAAERVEEEAMRIIHDWRMLAGQRNAMQYYEEAEAEFFRTLDFKAAIEFNDRRVEEQRRIAALNAERAENEQMRQQSAPAPEPEPVPALAPVPEPAPVAEPIAETRSRYRFEADLSASEISSLREWKNALSIGRNWTFMQVGQVNEDARAS